MHSIWHWLWQWDGPLFRLGPLRHMPLHVVEHLLSMLPKHA